MGSTKTRNAGTLERRKKKRPKHWKAGMKNLERYNIGKENPERKEKQRGRE